MAAVVLQRDVGAGDEVTHSRGDTSTAPAPAAPMTRGADVSGDPGDIGPRRLYLGGVQAHPDLDPDPLELVA
ncbi:MAG TPA: hypothetical protein VFA46_04310 [Actinomycetes bacterium]|jgi:hypothetical protein|nr:hypothetical protein [Actinomycetes bacterium]